MSASEQTSDEKLQEQAPRSQPHATRSWRACESYPARVFWQLLTGKTPSISSRAGPVGAWEEVLFAGSSGALADTTFTPMHTRTQGFIHFTFPCSISRQLLLLQQSKLKPYSSKEGKHMMVATQRVCEG
jgi:hypothetical protein